MRNIPLPAGPGSSDVYRDGYHVRGDDAGSSSSSNLYAVPGMG